jgi:hypothetical protein
VSVPAWTFVREASWINRQGERLNKVIAEEVKAAQQLKVDVRLADAYEEFGDHGACTKDRWVESFNVDVQSYWPFVSTKRSFHPTERGQEALATAVNNVLDPSG